MKKFLKFAATLAAVFMILSCFVACKNPDTTPGDPSFGDTTSGDSSSGDTSSGDSSSGDTSSEDSSSGNTVDTSTVYDIEKSGATLVVSSDEEIEAVIGLMMMDPAVEEIAKLFGGLIPNAGPVVPMARQAYEKADLAKVNEIINGYTAQFKNFIEEVKENGEGTLSIDDTITEVDLDKWLSIKDVLLKINADVSSDETSGSIEIDANAKVAAKAEIKLKELSETSGFGTIKCNFDVKADGKVSISESDEDGSGNISAGGNIAVAFPYADSTTGYGGRFIITLDADASAKLEEVMKLEEADAIEEYIKDNCEATLIIKVYDDYGKETYSKTMNLEEILGMFKGGNEGSEDER